MIEVPFLGKIIRRHSLDRRAKLCQASENPSCVLIIRANPHIKVLCITRFCVENEGNAANNQISNLIDVEEMQQFFEVGVQLFRPSAYGKTPQAPNRPLTAQ